MMKDYRVKFDVWGLILFLVIMLPNFVWFAVPAPHDILRSESATPYIDGVASVCQVLMVAMLCILQNVKAGNCAWSRWAWVTRFCVVIYYAAWIAYYMGYASNAAVVSLCVFPCVAFLAFEAQRKNILAMIPTALFSVCHLIYGLVNFVL